MADNEPRIVELEEKVAHLLRTNDELSAELAEQWKRIELLERKLGLLQEKLTEVALEASDPEPGNERPPHW